jgi:hypothetical protein
MHIVTTKEGLLVCCGCGHVFDKHPDEVRREKLHAQLCAIEDDDHAARAFHYKKTLQAQIDQMTTIWTGCVGYSIPGVGSVRVEGIEFTLEPGVAVESMIPELDKLIPDIKRTMIETLDGTKARIEGEISSNQVAVHKYDPVWCPNTPSAEELYPFGYIRHADGTVEAKSSV